MTDLKKGRAAYNAVSGFSVGVLIDHLYRVATRTKYA